VAGPSAQLILTLALDGEAFALFDRLRREHFPPERNVVPAHVTLFHALPGEERAAIASVLDLEHAARAPGRLEPLEGDRRVVRVHGRRRDLRRRRRLVGLPGVGGPLLVEELHPAVGVGNPDDLWDGVRHEPERRTGCAQ